MHHPSHRLRRVALALSLATATSCLLPVGLAALTPSPVAAAASGPILYVGDRASALDPIETVTNTVDPAIGLPLSADGFADGIAITPNGNTAYVADDVDGTLIPVNLATHAAGTPIQLIPAPGNLPANNFYTHDVAITPNGLTAYVAIAVANEVVPVALATGTPGTPIKVGRGPIGIAITPNGKTAYVSNGIDGTVTPITLLTRKPGHAVKIGVGNSCCQGGSTEVGEIAITPDGKTAYVAGLGFIGGITPITVATNRRGAPILLHDANVEGFAITPDGKTAYVANVVNGTLVPITLATRRAGAAIKLPGSSGSNFPVAVAITPDGKTIYVSLANPGGSVIPISTITRKPGTPISPVDPTRNIAMSPDEAPIAALSLTAGAAGAATSFDASASVGTTSPIVSYRWNFGDGTTLTTTGATTSHVYRAAKTYIASVTETDAAGTSTSRIFTGVTMSRNGGPSAISTVHVVVP